MTATEILHKLTCILVEQLGLEARHVTADARLREDLGADSLDCVEITMAVEEEFGLNICDEDAEKIKTVLDATQYLLGKVN